MITYEQFDASARAIVAWYRQPNSTAPIVNRAFYYQANALCNHAIVAIKAGGFKRIPLSLHLIALIDRNDQTT